MQDCAKKVFLSLLTFSEKEKIKYSQYSKEFANIQNEGKSCKIFSLLDVTQVGLKGVKKYRKKK